MSRSGSRTAFTISPYKTTQKKTESKAKKEKLPPLKVSNFRYLLFEKLNEDVFAFSILDYIGYLHPSISNQVTVGFVSAKISKRTKGY